VIYKIKRRRITISNLACDWFAAIANMIVVA